MSDAVSDTVRRILAEQAMIPIEAVGLQASPAELGLDSLGLVEAIFAIEEAFDIAVPFNASDTGENRFEMGTVAQVIEAVRGLVAARVP